MTKVLEELIELLSVEPLETNVFLGQSQDLGFPNVFGGQVLGQACMAASSTVKEGYLHSLHSYFLRPGLVSEPIYYEVDAIRTGRSFSTRRVVAKQRGRAIFNMSASFQLWEEGLDHQIEKPAVPGPDGIPSELELTRQIKDQIPVSIREKFTCDRPIEVRVIDPVDPFQPHKRPPKSYSWLRTAGQVDVNDSLAVALLAYASDFGLATVAMLPHGKSYISEKMQVASLDHAMWFHRPVRLDDWLLYEKDAPSARGGRGFNRGNIFSRSGELIASVAQESLIRVLK